MSKSWSSTEEHAIAAHDDEALETHETEGSEGGVGTPGEERAAPSSDITEPECLHRWTLVRLCDYCGEEERVFTDPGSVP